ncbi:hypothetical protein [Flaviaesturariibacter amylovorans]|uniref:Peptide chain release factor 1 n=1 Tax=Flaviaesturariibacter amylovorans TaxID=1084520 RepID=A0ABP8HIC7_9BACT
MGSKEITQLHEQLDQLTQQVSQSPEAARQWLEELGLFRMLQEEEQHDTPPARM